MADTHRVLLILGAGPRLGKGVASKFSASGYKVALAARSLTNGQPEDGMLHIQADLSDPQVVPRVFETTINTFGHPNVVVYNGAHRLLTPPEDPLSASLEILAASRTVGLDSGYVAAQQALRSFRTLPTDTPTAFIYTGNTLNQMPIPGVLPFALGKVAASHVIEYAANAYGKDGYKFYYADERQPNGLPVGGEGVGGETHAEMYWCLAHEAKQSKWLVTFTTENGQVARRAFEGVGFDGETRASYDQKFGRS